MEVDHEITDRSSEKRSTLVNGTLQAETPQGKTKLKLKLSNCERKRQTIHQVFKLS